MRLSLYQNNEIFGEIVVACGLTEATKTMGEYIRKFTDIYPDVTFHVRNGSSDFIIENIDNGLVDIGFVLEPVNLEKLNFLKMNKIERYGILTRTDSDLAKKDFITANDLKDVPLINTSRIETQNEFKKWIGKNDEELRVTAISELSTTASILVANNIGHAIVVEGSVNFVDDMGICFKPFYPELLTTSLMVWKKSQSSSYAVSKFIDFVSKEIKENR